MAARTPAAAYDPATPDLLDHVEATRRQLRELLAIIEAGELKATATEGHI